MKLVYAYVSGAVQIEVLAHRFYTGLNNFTLLAIPFFVLSGLLMEAGGESLRKSAQMRRKLANWRAWPAAVRA